MEKEMYAEWCDWIENKFGEEEAKEYREGNILASHEDLWSLVRAFAVECHVVLHEDMEVSPREIFHRLLWGASVHFLSFLEI